VLKRKIILNPPRIIFLNTPLTKHHNKSAVYYETQKRPLLTFSYFAAVNFIRSHQEENQKMGLLNY
jgi:hypothetical protein